MKTLLSGGIIYTFSPTRRRIFGGYLGIEDGRILFVSEEKPQWFVADRTINCHGCLVLPGFIDCHTHLAENLFKGLMDEVEFEGLFYTTLFRWEARLDPEMVYWGSLAGALDALRCGVTTVADMYHHAAATAKAVCDAGLRGYIGQKVLGFSLEQPPRQSGGKVDYNFSFSSFSRQLDEALSFAEEWQGADNGRITTSIAPHATNTLNREMFVEVASQARKNKLGIHLHLAQMASEQEAIATREGMGCVEFLADVGLLEVPVLGAHAIFLEDREIKLLKQYGVSISHNPVPNAKDAAVVAPVGAMLAAGVKIGLGTDAFQMNMLETARFAALINRVKTGRPGYLPAEEALAMATIGGATVLGLEHEIGSLEVGKRADVVVFDLQLFNTQPAHDPAKSLLYYGDTSNIKMVIVDGRVIYEHGEYSMIDKQLVQREFQQASTRLKTQLKCTANDGQGVE